MPSGLEVIKPIGSNNVPTEISYMLISHMDHRVLARLSQTCKTWNEKIQVILCEMVKGSALADEEEYRTRREVSPIEGTLLLQQKRVLKRLKKGPNQGLTDTIVNGESNRVYSFLKAGVNPNSHDVWKFSLVALSATG
ncbi:hypothetical protein BDV29DRAFT_158805 [Aspergillus leporis]|jgi:hypothetical protein|uniref:F-box domain-containing protein n=1 Tax=Aspergillus leporis TaxID=41062 RepID=A0A5N5WY35_9EURO|nr:hypothetical protein BDV29DRAFT_158805 [Aspergillus leporis]